MIASNQIGMGAVISKVNGLGLVEKEHLAAKLYVFTLAETLGVTDPAQGPFLRQRDPAYRLSMQRQDGRKTTQSPPRTLARR